MRLDVAASTALVPHSQIDRVFDVADPDRHGKIINAGPEVSEVRFDDGGVRCVGNQFLRTVEVPAAADELDSPTHQPEAAAIHDGQQAWARLRDHSTWQDWKAVGAAHVIGRVTAMRDGHTNKPRGRSYCAAFNAWAKKFGFADLDKGDRARLFNVTDHLAAIEAWLAELPLTERLRLNHPASIWRRWKAATAEPKPDAEKKSSPFEELKQSVVRLEEENARMKREIERGGGDLWSADDRPKDIAVIMIQKLGRAKAEKAAREIIKALKEQP
jgi:hypothetical protein